MNRPVPRPSRSACRSPSGSAAGGSWSSRPTVRPSARGRAIDSALVKAIARAHRWQRMLESGEYGSITELAAAEKINPSYLCRVLRLTLLAPEWEKQRV